MDMLTDLMSPGALALCLAIALLAGVIKGMVGFAMPMIMISGLSSVVGPELALAGLILPTLVTNGWQALRQGPEAAWESVKRFRLFLFVGGCALIVSAQLVRLIPANVLLLIIGAPIVVFAITQLMGKALRLSGYPSHRVEATVGGLAGFIGGMSGVWGPPTVAYLTAMDTPKKDQIRIQGVIYGLGALLLAVSHVGSGVLSLKTLPFSVALLPLALVGMWMGFQVQDRIDAVAFRKATLVVLLVAGANLVRRALMG
ncbi:sulfite exporter TauE/SafE family protein [Pseudooceanicola sp. 502str34]